VVKNRPADDYLFGAVKCRTKHISTIHSVADADASICADAAAAVAAAAAVLINFYCGDDVLVSSQLQHN